MFITPAYAQAATGTAPSGLAAIMQSPLPMFALVFIIFYFLVIRPQQKQQADHKAKVQSAQKGDTVLTAGGVYGKVTKTETDTVEVEIAPNVRVKVLRSTLADIQPLKPAKPAND
jgi:preprotein translocase subunit YajC